MFHQLGLIDYWYPYVYVTTKEKAERFGCAVGECLFPFDYPDADAFAAACRKIHADEESPKFLFDMQNGSCYEPRYYYLEFRSFDKDDPFWVKEAIEKKWGITWNFRIKDASPEDFFNGLRKVYGMDFPWVNTRGWSILPKRKSWWSRWVDVPKKRLYMRLWLIILWAAAIYLNWWELNDMLYDLLKSIDSDLPKMLGMETFGDKCARYLIDTLNFHKDVPRPF